MTATHFYSRAHLRRMERARLCIESAGAFVDEYLRKGFIQRAYNQVWLCQCPVDCWPSQLIAIHVGGE